MRSLINVFTALSVAIPWALGQNTTLSLNPNSVNLTTIYINDARGNRSVSYFVVKGFAIVDGDIVYGTEAALLSHAANRPDNTTIIRRNSPPTSKRSNSLFSPTGWPGGVVKYQYADAAMETQFSAAVDAAIANWKAVVPCLKFEKRPIGTNVLANPAPNTPNPSDALIVTAGDPNVPACFAPVGGPGAVVLVNGCGTAELTHELGHSLGLIHEVKRYDRDLNTQFFCKNLVDYPYDPIQKDDKGNPLHLPPQYGGGTYGGDTCCGENYPGVCCGWACQFNREPRAYTYTDQFPDDTGLNGGPYDLDSIMHYAKTAFAASGKQTLSHGPDGNPFKISPGDAARVAELFGCPIPPKPKCPKGCSPISGQNLCSIPTAQTCVYPTVGSKTPYCACRAGYKAGAYADGDTEHQWRVNDPSQIDRVWVAEGVVCDTLCNQPFGTGSCREVAVLDSSCGK